MSQTPRGQTRERVFQYVQNRLREGQPPTIREVQRALQFRAVETARAHLEALVKEGRLDKQPGKSRGFMLPPGDAQAPPRQVPILGNVQAGSLNTAIENLEGYLPVTTHYASDELFALRVSGESMTGAGIFPNDLVIVRRQASAKTGEIVVALVEDEATIKRLRIRDRRIELHPANPAFEVIVPSRYQCLILGKVIEVRRILERKPILSRMSPVNY